jgi:hypothetical protein
MHSDRRMEMTTQWRTLNTELLNKYYGGEEVEEDEMAGHAARMRDTM